MVIAVVAKFMFKFRLELKTNTIVTHCRKKCLICNGGHNW